MIYTSIPYSLEKRLGVEYNEFMKRLPNDDDFGCFIDHDAMFTTSTWFKQLQDIVLKYPECGCFIAMTNRIDCVYQRHGSVDPNNHDMTYHRNLGQKIQQKDYSATEDVSNKNKLEAFGGILIVLKKSVWKKIGGFDDTGILGVDNKLHWSLMDHNEKVYLMKGMYLYHWYRADGKGKKHLIA